MNLIGEGSVTFWAKGDHDDWATNDNGYNFTPTSGEGIEIKSRKTPEKRIEISIGDNLGNDISFDEPMPECDARGLFVALTWKGMTVKLLLNGKPVAKKDLKLVRH